MKDDEIQSVLEIHYITMFNEYFIPTHAIIVAKKGKDKLVNIPCLLWY
jgi:hypothetical protein